MARLLPFRRSDRPVAPREPRLVDLADESADEVFAALSAGTARDILSRLYEAPGTATDVAEAADTSLQNARYHLEKLQTAGLVEAVDTWYSSRGTEMTVYAPTNAPLVVAAGADEQTSVLRAALSRLVGALAVLGVASLVVDRLARFGLVGLFPFGATGSADGGDEPEFQGQEVTVEAGGGATGGAGGGADGDAANISASTTTDTATAAPEATAAGNETAVREATAAATGTPTPVPTPEPTATATPTPTPATDAGLFDLAGGLPPGGLFFLGGLVVLAAIAAWWYWRRYRPLYG